MIVKNEEVNLPRCLDSASQLVDEIVVVDTGSSDRTKELAATKGAQVFDFAWIDDFSAARNESIRRSTGDWIFWLDADEWLDESNQFLVKGLLTSLDDRIAGYVMLQHSPTQYLWDGEPARAEDQIARQVRLFRSDPRIRWESRIFEQIRPSIRRAGGSIETTEIVIQHSGYQSAQCMHTRLVRNLRLIEMQNRDQPGDPYTLYSLADLLCAAARSEEAIPHLERCLEISPGNSLIWLRAAELLARIRQSN
jgi:glycosyltransferase involved in cell wall biosynthesis